MAFPQPTCIEQVKIGCIVYHRLDRVLSDCHEGQLLVSLNAYQLMALEQKIKCCIQDNMACKG
eukprot:15332715-Ditylum_brightwellii.AAC.1